MLLKGDTSEIRKYGSLFPEEALLHSRQQRQQASGRNYKILHGGIELAINQVTFGPKQKNIPGGSRQNTFLTSGRTSMLTGQISYFYAKAHDNLQVEKAALQE